MNAEREVDTAFAMVLRAMDRLDVGFDLQFRVEGEPLLDAALGHASGTLMIGTHAWTTTLITRALYDAGIDFHVVASGPRYHIPGTPQWVDTIEATPYMLVRVRSALRRGEVVFALLDRGAPQTSRTTRIDTALGEVHIAEAILRIAATSGTPTIFMMSSMSDDGTVHVCYSAPRAGANATASELMRDFSSAIIDHHVALAARGSSLER